ncbi:Bpu10I family restriction endonuclease [uncultured Thiodictyon sp.]|uniref:Bpu10I family restriction endonuclease n=1 Tax=uncultured Thiodictyon sp. TaxID=1846217 RepID=UPI0034526AE4
MPPRHRVPEGGGLNDYLGSNVRQEYRTPELRRQCRDDFVEFVDGSQYYSDVFQRMVDKIQAVIDDSSPTIDKVLEQGHF